MIEKLEIKIDSDLYHSNTKEIIDKINEIIAFLNGTFLMQKPDTVTIPLEDCTFVTGLCTDDDLSFHAESNTTCFNPDVKCPHCGESYYTVMYSNSTCVYYPPIYKDGVNINPDRNTTTQHCQCLNCGKEFTI